MHLFITCMILLIVMPSMLLDSLTAARARRQLKQPLRLVWALSSDTMLRPARQRQPRSSLHQIVMPLCSA